MIFFMTPLRDEQRMYWLTAHLTAIAVALPEGVNKIYTRYAYRHTWKRAYM